MCLHVYIKFRFVLQKSTFINDFVVGLHNKHKVVHKRISKQDLLDVLSYCNFPAYLASRLPGLILSLINYLSYLEPSAFSKDLFGPAGGSLARGRR